MLHPNIQRLTRTSSVRFTMIAVLSIGAILLFVESRAEWSPMHKWNRAVGDVSLLLFALTMAIGPAARMWRVARPLLPWRRELGIQTFIFASVHTVIILAGWVEWDFIQLFGYVINPQSGQYILLQHGFGLANIVGIMALGYALMLTLTSNNISQRVMGGPVWKYIQQSAYVLWSLVVIHTAYFLYMHFQHFHRPDPDPNWLQVPFAVLVLSVLLLQSTSTFRTWRQRTDSKTAAQLPDKPGSIGTAS